MLLSALAAALLGAPKALPTAPKQFTVRIETTAHQLNATSDQRAKTMAPTQRGR